MGNYEQSDILKDLVYVRGLEVVEMCNGWHVEQILTAYLYNFWFLNCIAIKMEIYVKGGGVSNPALFS